MREGIVRLVATRGTPSMRLVRHVTGDIRPPTAYARMWLGGVGVEVLGRDGRDDISGDQAAMARLMRGFHTAARLATKLDARKRGGKPANLGMSVLFTGGPEVNDVHRDESTIPDDAPATLAEGRPWTLSDCREYAGECQSLLRDACPGAWCIVGLHVDETSVHVHGEMPALVRQSDRTYRIGNAAVREGFARLAPSFPKENERIRQAAIAREAKAAAGDAAAVAAGRKPKPRRRFIDKGPDAMYLGAEAQMRLAHDAYAHRMARFGIERGRGGGKAYAVAIDRGKGMRAKLEAMERDRREAERESEEARAAAETARAEEEAARARADEAREQAGRVHEQAVEELRGRDEARLERAQAERERNAARAEHDKLRGEFTAVEADSGFVRRRRRHRELKERERAVEARERGADEHDGALAERRAAIEAEEARAAEQRAATADEAAAVQRREEAVEERETRVRGLEAQEKALQAGQRTLAAAQAALEGEQAAVKAAQAKAAEDRKATQEALAELRERQRLTGINAVVDATAAWVRSVAPAGRADQWVREMKEFVTRWLGPQVPEVNSDARTSGVRVAPPATRTRAQQREPGRGPGIGC